MRYEDASRQNSCEIIQGIEDRGWRMEDRGWRMEDGEMEDGEMEDGEIEN